MHSIDFLICLGFLLKLDAEHFQLQKHKIFMERIPEYSISRMVSGKLLGFVQ